MDGVGGWLFRAERSNFKLWVLFTAVECSPIPAKNPDTLWIDPPFYGPFSSLGCASLVRVLAHFGPDEILASLGWDATLWCSPMRIRPRGQKVLDLKKTTVIPTTQGMILLILMTAVSTDSLFVNQL